MSLLNKLTIRNIKLNKKRSIVTVIGIILSVALITALANMFFSARASIINYTIEQYGNYHYVFTDVPATDFKYFKENRALEDFYLTSYIGYAPLKESNNEYKPYILLRAFSKKAFSNLGINLIDGRLPENDTEIVIPEHLKSNGLVDYKIGDELTLDIGDRLSNEDNIKLPIDAFYTPEEEHLGKNFTKKYKIVGIIERPSYAVEEYSSPGYSFFTYLDEDNLSSNVDVYTRLTSDSLANKDQVVANILGVDLDLYLKCENIDYIIDLEHEERIELEDTYNKIKKYEFNSNNELITLESNYFAEPTTQALAIASLIVCIIIIIASVFCIKNSFDISLTEKIRQYGMLSSIGATKKQIKKSVYYEGLILGLIAIPLGIICGLIASSILIVLVNIFLKDLYPIKFIYVISWYAILLSIILGLITIFLSSWRSAHKAAKISPIEAIRNSSELKIKSKKLKIPKFIDKLFGIGGTISYKNLKRNKKNYRPTVVSIVVCLSIFISLYYFMNLAFKTINEQLNIADYNITFHFNSNHNRNEESYLDSIIKLDNIDQYVRTYEMSINIKDYKYSQEFNKINKNFKGSQYCYMGNEPADEIEENKVYSESISLIKVNDEEYKNYLKKLNLDYDKVKDEAILLNNVTDSYYDEGKKTVINSIIPYLDYHEGDTIKLYFGAGSFYCNPEAEKEIYEFKIAKLTDEVPFGIAKRNMKPRLIISEEQYNKINGRNSGVYDYLYINSSNPDKLQSDIENILQGNFSEDDYMLINSNEGIRERMSLYTLLAIFLYGFITVIALIGITNIFNTITTSMELRKREFAMLKSIGMTDKEFKRMIRLESLFYGFKSLIIGLPLGCLLSYVIYYYYSKYTNDLTITFNLPYFAIITGTIVVLLLIISIMKYSINKINKQNIIETIRNENI